jgi:hypothetical protein
MVMPPLDLKLSSSTKVTADARANYSGALTFGGGTWSINTGGAKNKQATTQPNAATIPWGLIVAAVGAVWLFKKMA